jgi:hypothetical protein
MNTEKSKQKNTDKALTIPVVRRSSFVGKKFVKGDVVEIDEFDYLRDAPFIYKDLDANTFLTVTGKLYWKHQVKSIEQKSLWSKILWMFQ